MTRKAVYVATLAVIGAATALTIASIALPQWISFTSTTPTSDHLHLSYGLHRACSSLTGSCRPFPDTHDCQGSDRYFCSLWRTTGFLMSFTAIVELATLVAFVVIILGGKQKRATGWPLLAGMAIVAALAECAAMAIVAYLYDNDDRFFVGWRLDKSWILATVSWSITLVSAGALALSSYIFPTEDGYELIPSERQWG